MNYIQQLQHERDSLRAEVERLRAGYQTLKSYLTSDKFASCDPIERAVNPDDILLRIYEILYTEVRA